MTATSEQLPVLIQGGMGVAISDWRLARAVAQMGQLGVVSGTALDVVAARRLGDGDPGGHMRRALSHAPAVLAPLAQRVLDRWYQPGGRRPGERYRAVPMARVVPSKTLSELMVVASFAEVWLAKEGHDGPVGVNLLEKVQLPTPHTIYGALLAGVDYVLMGAGIPAQIPALLDDLSRGLACDYRISVAGSEPGDVDVVHLDPTDLLGVPAPQLARPRFLAIIASNTLAAFLMKDPATTPDGFVVEGPTAGGHNAPPRGKLQLDERGEPIYGARDEVDLDKMAAAGLPFWLAGGYADPVKVREALSVGAAGVQVGTAFALCDESGLRDDLREDAIRRAPAGQLEIRTDPRASPSGFPFKVATLPGTVSDDDVYEQRRRVCDLGYLRTSYRKPDGSVGYRCPSEPVESYVAKGGAIEDTVGRKCLCNGLMATAGFAQERAGGPQPAIVTLGDDVGAVIEAFGGPTGHWSAADVVEQLLSKVHA